MDSLGQIVWQVLRQAGWLPAAEATTHVTDLLAGDDILPAIEKAWSLTDASGVELRRGRRWQSWAEGQMAAGARLTIGPHEEGEGFRRWNGMRLVWWPRGIPTGQRVGLVSSHFGRNLNQSRDWFRMFRAACAKVDRRHEVIVTAATTTTHEFARRAAELFDLRLLLLTPPGKDQDCRSWLHRLAGQSWPAEPCYDAHVSPTLETGLVCVSRELVQLPLADRILMAMSERLLLFHVRRRGKLLPLIKLRLTDPTWRPQSVYVALGPKLVPRPIADELLTAGAVGWVVLGDSNDKSIGNAPTDDVSSLDATLIRTSESLRITSLPAVANGPYLIHCTRAARRAWPDQSQDDFLDDLIFSADSADHSALAALRRILIQQQILATSSAIRGGTALVSFTAVRLADVPGRRIFRVHRGRWDFEPYGICIRQDALEQLGTRPVIYGGHSDWDGLDASDRPFFQRRLSKNEKTGVTTDWSQELEWRILGNVDLGVFDDHSALVFVPTVEEARMLLPHSRWPIVVLDA
jgi:hypothetical protein